MKQQIQHILSLVRPQFRLDIHHGWHGIGHWSRVWRNAKELCEVMNVNPLVPCMFSFLHDSQRFDEGSDIEHGRRAVRWIETLYLRGDLRMSAADFYFLCEAIRGHSHGETDAIDVVQICWDADRLDLGRVGMMPDVRFLCTPHAKKPETIQAAYARSIGEPQNVSELLEFSV